MSRRIMSPFGRKTVGIEFFHYRASVQTRAHREYIAAALNTAKQQSFVESKRDFALIKSATPAPNRASDAAALVVLSFDFQVRFTRKGECDSRRAARKKRFIDISSMRLQSMVTGLSPGRALAKQLRPCLGVSDRAQQNDRGTHQK
jgi:hypothetical protein